MGEDFQKQKRGDRVWQCCEKHQHRFYQHIISSNPNDLRGPFRKTLQKKKNKDHGPLSLSSKGMLDGKDWNNILVHVTAACIQDFLELHRSSCNSNVEMGKIPDRNRNTRPETSRVRECGTVSNTKVCCIAKRWQFNPLMNWSTSIVRKCQKDMEYFSTLLDSIYRKKQHRDSIRFPVKF